MTAYLLGLALGVVSGWLARYLWESRPAAYERYLDALDRTRHDGYAECLDRATDAD